MKMSMNYLKAKIIGYIYEKGGEASIGDLMEKFSERKELILPLTLGMLRDGIIEGTGKTSLGDITKMKIKIKKVDISKIMSILTQSQMKEMSENVMEAISLNINDLLEVNTTAKIVLTLPDNLMVKVMHRGINIKSTVECFSELFKKAQKEILLSVPFFEEEAILYFHSELRSAAQKGVKLKILVRGFFDPKGEYEFVKLLKGLRRIYDLYDSWGNTSLLEIRDFHHVVKVSSESKPKHYESIHSKLLLVDEKWGYIGSAEMRRNALFHNFETGLEINGKIVKILEEIFNVVWENSRIIDLQKLKASVDDKEYLFCH